MFMAIPPRRDFRPTVAPQTDWQRRVARVFTVALTRPEPLKPVHDLEEPMATRL